MGRGRLLLAAAAILVAIAAGGTRAQPPNSNEGLPVSANPTGLAAQRIAVLGERLAACAQRLPCMRACCAAAQVTSAKRVAWRCPPAPPKQPQALL